MQLPPFPEVSYANLAAIAARHELRATQFTRLPQVGICNAVYQKRRVPGGRGLHPPRATRRPEHHRPAGEGGIVAPAAWAAGVHTPALVAFDGTLDLLPVSCIIYQRAHGETLGLLDLEPTKTPDVWSALGRDLAQLHSRTAAVGPLAELRHEPPA